MPTIGLGEAVMLVIIIAIVFSASKMGQLGDAVGRFVFNFRKASKGEQLLDSTARKTDRGTEDAQIVDSKKR